MNKHATIVLFALLLATTFAFAQNQGVEVHLPDYYQVYQPWKVPAPPPLSKTGAGWSAFTANNPSWNAFFNQATGNPHRAWGKGVQIEGVSSITAKNAERAGELFLRQFAEVLRIRPDELKLLQAENVNGKWYYSWKQTYKGLDVLNSYTVARVTPDGRVFLFGSDFNPDIDISIEPTLSPAAAREFAKAGLQDDPAAMRTEEGALSILPLEYGSHNEYRLVYNVVVTTDPEHAWDTYVDANDGSILWRYNLVRRFTTAERPPKTTKTFSGRITADVFPNSYINPPENRPLEDMYVWVEDTMLITDEQGRFSLDVSGKDSVHVIIRLSGVFTKARRVDSVKAGGNALIDTVIAADRELLVNWTDENSHAAERMTAYHVTVVHNYTRSLDSTDAASGIDKQIPAIVNINRSCNAFWNGKSVNFFKESSRCGNTGEMADVIYHEYGHGINQIMYQALGREKGMVNGALNEATADIQANLILDDPRIGIGFRKPSNPPNFGIIRNSDNDYKYPEDLKGEVHRDGMILTGAMWDTRKNIGLDITRKLAQFVRHGTPDAGNHGEAFTDYFFEILVADDDDGDLSNGTPHSTGIIPAFIKHGIPAAGIILAHNALKDQLPNKPITVTGSARVPISLNPDVLRVEELKVVWTTDNGKTFDSAPLPFRTKTRFDGKLPGFPVGTLVRYYIEAKDNFGSIIRIPAKAPQDMYPFLVGFKQMFFDDQEKDNSWVVDPDQTDSARTGIWVREKPVGTVQAGSWVQTNMDHTPGTGTICWVTGNAAQNAKVSANDVDSGQTTLQTTTLDASGMQTPVLRYWRWHTGSGMIGKTDPWVVLISNDDGQTWTEVENTRNTLAEWTPIVFFIKDYIEPTDKMKLRFIAADYPPEGLVEAAVDDLEILDVDPTLSVQRINGTATGFALEQNYPNPFSPTTTIRFSIPDRSPVSLKIYNSLGQLVRAPVHKELEGGSYRVTVDATGLPPGVYYYLLANGHNTAVRKMIVGK
ncbi:MAG: T9SS type A sorting domain-containing protein [Chlorobi bacterium]|nr:T9SS type A sorting domain-containing protein [Chlorobiota bacterium]